MSPFGWARRLLLATTVAVLGLLALATPALAQVAPDGDISPDAPVSAYLTLNNTVVLILTGFVVPLLNGLLLRPENPAWVKVLVADVVATVVHAFSQVIQEDGTAFLSQEWVLGLLLTVGSMIAGYLGVWRPLIDPNRTLPSVQGLARAA